MIMFDLCNLQIVLIIFIVLYYNPLKTKCDEDTRLGGYVDAGFQKKTHSIECVFLLYNVY